MSDATNTILRIKSEASSSIMLPEYSERIIIDHNFKNKRK